MGGMIEEKKKGNGALRAWLSCGHPSGDKRKDSRISNKSKRAPLQSSSILSSQQKASPLPVSDEATRNSELCDIKRRQSSCKKRWIQEIKQEFWAQHQAPTPKKSRTWGQEVKGEPWIQQPEPHTCTSTTKRTQHNRRNPDPMEFPDEALTATDPPATSRTQGTPRNHNSERQLSQSPHEPRKPYAPAQTPYNWGDI